MAQELNLTTEFGRAEQLLRLLNRTTGLLSLADVWSAVQAEFPSTVPCDFIQIALQDERTKRWNLLTLKSCLSAATRAETGAVARQSDIEEVWHSQLLIVSEPAPQFGEQAPALCIMPLSTARKRLGVLVVCRERDLFQAVEVSALQCAAKIVAVAIEHARECEALDETRARLTYASSRVEAICGVASACVSSTGLHDFSFKVSASLRVLIGHQYAGLTIYEPDKHQLRLRALDFPRSKGFIRENLLMPVKRSLSGTVFESGQPMLLGTITDRELTYQVASVLTAEGLKSACFVPLRSEDGPLGTLNFESNTPDAFSEDHVQLLTEISTLVGNAADRILRNGQKREPNTYLRLQPPRPTKHLVNEQSLRDLVGVSQPFQAMLETVKTVAPTDASVLVLGETGTGKELIARAVHDLSPRRDRNFVTINCSAIPAQLLESELFGHERGAFTGAIAPRVGRFEMAHGGTLFLDEVGDMPLELQAKPLRVRFPLWQRDAATSADKRRSTIPIRRRFWRTGELILSSYAVSGGERSLYQQDTVTLLLHPMDLLNRYREEWGEEIGKSAAMFCGTIPAHGGIAWAESFHMELYDPVLNRRLTHRYDVYPLPTSDETQ